ncbi:MAG TPA: hypothetical protein VGO52_25945 [Hyphomonadaceae bacterium]|jgi:hypothetical protein|nr:hypothetical protein [Hyphomonadaceae bacterium]
MNFDEMLEVWRTQDRTPAYRVNPDLLRVVVRQEHAGLQREVGLDLWFVPWALWMAAAGMLAVVFAVFYAATLRGWAQLGMWDYVAAGVATGAWLVWPAVYWASYRRQPSRERGFGNSLQEEIQLNLLRVDDQLSRYGRLAPSLVMFAPLGVVAIVFFWVSFRMSAGSYPSQIVPVIVAASMVWPMFWAGHAFKKRLLEQRRQLSQLLELLNASE